MSINNKSGKNLLINRLKRIEGQCRGIQRMIESETDCQKIIVQLNALNSAVRNATKAVLAQYLKKCFLEETNNEQNFEDILNKITDLLMKTKI